MKNLYLGLIFVCTVFTCATAQAAFHKDLGDKKSRSVLTLNSDYTTFVDDLTEKIDIDSSLLNSMDAIYLESENQPLSFQDVLDELVEEQSEAVETADFKKMLCVISFTYLFNAGGPAIDMHGRPSTQPNKITVLGPREGSTCPIETL